MPAPFAAGRASPRRARGGSATPASPPSPEGKPAPGRADLRRHRPGDLGFVGGREDRFAVMTPTKEFRRARAAGGRTPPQRRVSSSGDGLHTGHTSHADYDHHAEILAEPGSAGPRASDPLVTSDAPAQLP